MTNGVNTNGVAAKVYAFDRLRKTVRTTLRLVPPKSICQNHVTFAVALLELTPFVPLRGPTLSCRKAGRGPWRKAWCAGRATPSRTRPRRGTSRRCSPSSPFRHTQRVVYEVVV